MFFALYTNIACPVTFVLTVVFIYCLSVYLTVCFFKFLFYVPPLSNK